VYRLCKAQPLDRRLTILTLQIEDLSKDYPGFQQYNRNGLELELEFHKAEKLPENVLDWAFTLCKANMEDFYNTSWGWNDTSKREELNAPEARFLLAYTKVSFCPHQQRALPTWSSPPACMRKVSDSLLSKQDNPSQRNPHHESA
jgi:hypothetical protein